MSSQALRCANLIQRVSPLKCSLADGYDRLPSVCRCSPFWVLKNLTDSAHFDPVTGRDKHHLRDSYGNALFVRDKASEATSIISASTEARLDNITILFVEDDVDVRDSVACLLSRAGASIIKASSAREALKISGQRTGFHILLTDHDLQDELSGTDLAWRLYNSRPALGVTVLSGCVDQVLLERMHADWQALAKPATALQLISALRASIGRMP